MTKISKPTTSATVTPTVDAASVARCGIPAPTANGRGNIKLSLAGDAAAKMAALCRPKPKLFFIRLTSSAVRLPKPI